MTVLPHLQAMASANDNHARVLVFEDLELSIRIGAFEAEKLAPQRVLISVEVLIQPRIAAHEDRLGNVVDYDRLHAKILALAERPHIALQETLADEVAGICLEPDEVAAVEVYVRKIDVYADCRSVGIRIVRTRS